MSNLAPRSHLPAWPDRRTQILAVAAAKFATRGYLATSMRDVAADVGILAGSIYHHFRSKDDLLVEAYALGVADIIAATERALNGRTDPWDRLEAACTAHLEALLAETPFAALMPLDLRQIPETPRARLIAERDRYERHLIAIVKSLDLAPTVDRQLLRFLLLGALNWTPTWYRSRGRTPAGIAEAYVRTIRHGLHGSRQSGVAARRL
jgi:AcrR family transcriptional regulator